MSNHEEGITSEEYFARLEAGISYEGPVIDLGYAIKEIIVTPIPENQSQTQVFWHMHSMNVLIPYSPEYLDQQENSNEDYPKNRTETDYKALISQGVKIAIDVGDYTIGGISTYYLHKGEYLLVNEFWRRQPSGKQKWITPFSKMSNGQNYWNNNIVTDRRNEHLRRVDATRRVGNKISLVGTVFIIADIGISGEVKPSHAINAGLIYASASTGVGAIAAGIWFIFDFGTMGTNYLINGEAKGLGDIIDEKVGTIDVYGYFNNKK